MSVATCCVEEERYCLRLMHYCTLWARLEALSSPLTKLGMQTAQGQKTTTNWQISIFLSPCVDWNNSCRHCWSHCYKRDCTDCSIFSGRSYYRPDYEGVAALMKEHMVEVSASLPSHHVSVENEKCKCISGLAYLGYHRISPRSHV